MSTTLVVVIGNSDNKLTQQEWADYAAKTAAIVHHYATTQHFAGCSPGTDPRQHACWIVEMDPALKGFLETALQRLCHEFRQDSIAVLTGETQMIGPRSSNSNATP
jgi:hypothetical protein